MPWSSMQSYLKSWFDYGTLSTNLTLVSIALAMAFGIIWLLTHWPPLFKSRWLWAVLVSSPFLTLLAMVFIQTPLQYYLSQGLSKIWNEVTYTDWLYLTAIPSLLIGCLVQAGALMLPVAVWWLASKRNLEPKMGMVIGAVAGVGYGIFEAVRSNTQIFAGGWNLSNITGMSDLLPFWGRFWAIAIYAAVTAIVGYGLAKNKGWRFYFLSAGLYLVSSYFVVFYFKGNIDYNQYEIITSGVAALLILASLYLRWRRNPDEMEIDETGESETPAQADI
jgi:hypothetical protein